MEKDTQPELRLEWWEPDKLTPNPLNWRRHPTHQKQSFAGVISQVGWAGAALYNEQTSHLIDGHLRRDWAIEASERVPVLVGSWTLEQEKLILATLDPLAGLAETDDAKLAELLRGVQADDAAVVAMLAKLGEDSGAVSGVEDYSDLDSQLETLDGMEEVDVHITIPVKHKQQVIEWLANGEVKTAPGMGKGVLRRCGLL